MSALPIPTLPETLTTPDDDLCSPWQSYEARKREMSTKPPSPNSSKS